MNTIAIGFKTIRTTSLLNQARNRPSRTRWRPLSNFQHEEHHQGSSARDHEDVWVSSFEAAEDSIHQSRRSLRSEQEITISSSSVRIPIANGPTSLHLPVPWLWVNDPCNIQKGSGQKLQTPLSYFAANARIVKASIVPAATIHDRRITIVPKESLHSVGGLWQSKNVMNESSSNTDELLQVTWKTKDSSFDSFYSLDWLMERRNAANRKEEASTTRIIGSATELFTMEYNQLFPDLQTGDRAALFHLLNAIFRDGAALVQAAPIPAKGDDDLTCPVARVGRLLGGGTRLSHGHLYGDIFHVEAVPDANNIAFTSVELTPHQDLAYYESPPGLQLLHCVANQHVTGGTSTLMDAMAAANALRTLAPSMFRCLAETNTKFIKQREKADMCYNRPHIRLEAGGDRVVSVHWSPPFEGPLDEVLNGQRAQDYFVAHAAFQRMVDNALPSDQYLLQDVLSNDLEDRLIEYANKHTWEHQLQVGEILIFSNQRMLHGRRSFTLDCPETSRRFLMGTYTNIDETVSEYRVLRRQQNNWNDFGPVMAGNGSA